MKAKAKMTKVYSLVPRKGMAIVFRVPLEDGRRQVVIQSHPSAQISATICRTPSDRNWAKGWFDAEIDDDVIANIQLSIQHMKMAEPGVQQARAKILAIVEATFKSS